MGLHQTGLILEISVVVALFSHLELIAGELENIEHRTNGALIMKNDLSCYVCDFMEDGKKCSDLSGNKTAMLKKCHGDRRLCMIKRYSYTTMTENSTSDIKLWSLSRSCTSKCEPGCIIIGERTKLYACTTCCPTNGCNNGKGAGMSFENHLHLTAAAFFFVVSTVR